MKRRLFTGLLGIAASVLVLLIAFGYMVALHPAGDSFAVFRTQLAALLLAVAALAFASRLRKLSAICAAVAMFAGLPLLVAYLQPGKPGSLTLYQKNLLFISDDLSGLATDIANQQPDFITLQEVSVPNQDVMKALLPSYPTQHLCPFARRIGGTAVLSTFPAVPGTATCVNGMTAIQLETGAGPVWLISIHLQWPWPYGQAEQVNDLLPAIAALQGPKIIGGDFNMVPWSGHMRRFADAGAVQLAQPVRGTYTQFGPLLHLPIDHVLTPAGGTTTLRPLLGSDHLGMLVRFDLPQPANHP